MRDKCPHTKTTQTFVQDVRRAAHTPELERQFSMKRTFRLNPTDAHDALPTVAKSMSVAGWTRNAVARFSDDALHSGLCIRTPSAISVHVN
jgi:hypothetical protein